jgi:glycerol kinase
MPGATVLAIDQGTSSTKCVLVDESGSVVARASAPVRVLYPQPGFVEQDADELWASVLRATADCLRGQDSSRVAAVGISNQRESIVAWDAASGRPLGPVLGWQDHRSAAICDRVRAAGGEKTVRGLSGLPLDPMFSAAKASWLLDAYDAGRSRARAGSLRLGTVDSWLLFRLLGRHVTEPGNASRTQLYDVAQRHWSAELLELFDVPAEALAEVVPSEGRFGVTSALPGLERGVPVLAVLADSHAALFGHGGSSARSVKATFGTGTSVMGRVPSPDAVGDELCVSLAWEDTAGPVYAAEGNIRVSGALIAWLAEVLGTTPAELDELAAATASSDVDIVPAFGGMGAPWWDDRAVGLVTGISLGTGRGELARAAFEAVALQVADVVAALARAAGGVEVLMVDGGGTASDTLMTLTAGFTQTVVRRSVTRDLSAVGAARMAGRAAGLWDDALSAPEDVHDVIRPGITRGEADRRLARWHAAIDRSRHRVDSG